MNRIFLAVILPVLLSSCMKQREKELTDNNLYSILWIQSAAEYRANSMTVYRAAADKLTMLVTDKTHTALPTQKEGYHRLPPAVILDVDETVLDNSPYQAMLVKDDKIFESDTWNHWIGLKQAEALPGVVDFLNKAQEMGVTVFFITNRKCVTDNSDPCPQDEQTCENLRRAGITNVISENVMLSGEQENWGPDKTSRRELVAENYRVIMLFGDNLGDFIADTAKTVEDRNALVYQYADRWGSCWFMSANPVYGGWQDVLESPDNKNLITY